MLVVAALGGNALLRRGESPDQCVQRHHVAEAATALAKVAADHQLVVCHGNGPQIGMLALESESDDQLTEAFTLDVLGAQTQGMIGYWLVQELANAGLPGPVAAIVTQTRVDPGDPSFAAPTKPIGPLYDEQRAQELASAHTWSIAPDSGGWRRVVPSPAPLTLVEEAVIARLVAEGVTVVCGGGGGVPVVGEAGRLRGVDGVVDKDLTAAVLAAALGAERFVVLTDVPGVMRDFGTPDQELVRELRVADIEPGDYPAGSMGPKLAACADFVRRTGRPAAIGSLEDAALLVAGEAGTAVSL
ncbi:carbamate kinase [Kribbella ginsengisoli]|uniref:Carbamate kinase n=1 Tax=Kribbella ginsengisoli TaxID=363865 RepID=A0ABP6Z9H2_9ACTN